ncbi:MAG: RNA methyltransferase [Bacteroidota bacterium]|nr:RNA methyltransferase [Bacteroidota bacterium]
MRKLLNSELNRLNIEQFKETTKTPIIVVLDNLRSCNNIGSVFRTSDALLIEAVYLCGITATPPNKEIHKTALDAENTVNWRYFEKTEDAVVDLRNQGYKIISIEQVEGSIPLSDYAPSKNEKLALIFGNEVKGVAQQIVDNSDCCIEIPQYGTKHSFNVSVSTGIVLWDLFNKLKGK